MLVGVNAFATVVGTMVSVAVLLGGPATGDWSVVMPEVVLVCAPATVPLTPKVAVQLPFAGITMPLKLRLVAFAANVLPDKDPHVPPTEPPTATMPVRLSVNDASTPTGFVLLNVTVTVDALPNGIVAGLKAFNTVGIVGAFTVRFAVLLGAPAVGVRSVVTPEVVFGCEPTELLRTSKLTTQLPLAGRITPVKLSAVAFAAILIGASNAQLPTTGPPTALIFVSVSLNAANSPNGLGFVNVSVTVAVPPAIIAVGAKAFAIVGAPYTVRLAGLLTVPGDGVCVVVTPEVIFGCVPSVLLVTLNTTVQLSLDGMPMPLKLKAVAPADKVAGVVPTQVPVTAPPTALMFVSVSVNDAFVSGDALLFVNVSVTVVLPPA